MDGEKEPLAYFELVEIVRAMNRAQLTAQAINGSGISEYEPIDFLAAMVNRLASSAEDARQEYAQVIAEILPAFVSGSKRIIGDTFVELLPEIAQYTSGIVTEQLLLTLIKREWPNFTEPLVRIAECTQRQNPPVVTAAVLAAEGWRSSENGKHVSPLAEYLEYIETLLPGAVTEAVWRACGTSPSLLAVGRDMDDHLKGIQTTYKNGVCDRTFQHFRSKSDLGGGP